MIDTILHILDKCKIFQLDNDISNNDKITMLPDILIPRNKLLDNELYNELKEDIEFLRSKCSSSYLTCLQKNALDKQKWPLLNLIRQLLLIIGYKMIPVRKSNGYDKKTKKKLYIRFFRIEKMIV